MTATDPSPFALDMPAPQVREHPAKVLAGLPVLVLAIALSLAGGYPIYLLTIGTAPLWPLVASAVAFLAAGLLYAGLTVVAPREARVIQFLGAYVGTVREPGLLSLRDSAEGAVGMVEMALERLEQRGVVELDDERRAAMVSNLLVVLCGTQATQPVVNTGTLYS